ncbi:Muskelin N-terminus-domain-containing protein [Gamsiella multidivaricata]|uniref:Muskelin N-terminus-domain-containing protein n=1 Tax=Gamsiella multidivaricata TaxID=101098 RepID=UPI00221ED956|nr:Muskelin N-terminus-domain-containing protein [Gamsiella multidivaricata]KAI7816573.1 Muskelin N-terminus-domain-containing protein [Gamsiella multidivaricata]
MRPRVLDYDVHSCSSYSSSFLPGNIKINNPQDQSSRWSSGSNNQMQYVMIQLKTMAIAHTITFGKYHKVHVCNLKEFKVFGGLTTSNMTELLHTGLRNDSEPETFLLKHKTNSVVFPCQYIKIVPLVAWGANFNFSVWHVEVKGIPDPELVQETYFQYINFRETKSVRLCLKHFRQRKLLDAFKALQDRTNIELEHPLLTMLHHELVVRGNFKRAEELMIEAAERGLFDDYIRSYDYKPMWKRLQSNSHRQGFHHHHHSHQAHDEEGPRQRGGHQMCIDTQGGYVYLMGGWDGARELADFWAYHIPSQVWILISADTSLQGGPSARSCHKVCYSPQHRAIFLLGKYVDPDNRSKVDLSSDFWRFDINSASPPHGRWTKISGNTAIVNGPELIYDHQMCLDPVSQTLYIFGGRVVHLDKNVQHYSGLYSYHIPSGVWRLLRADGQPPPKQDGATVLRSRIGHSMLYDDMTRSLVIFAGQMNKDYLSDFYVYDIAADRVIEVCKDYNKQGGPEAGFTQRATISSRGREIYVLSGLVKDRALGAETVKNSFWVFKLPAYVLSDQGSWQKIFQNSSLELGEPRELEPVPRYAHQLVYDDVNEVQYLFGGNPGEQGNMTKRLDDFWELRLYRPKPEEIVRRAKYLLRTQQFKELCRRPEASAMTSTTFLQTELSCVVDQSNKTESDDFKALIRGLLLGAFSPSMGDEDSDMDDEEHDAMMRPFFRDRTLLYEKLLDFFSDEMKQPKGDLVDLVKVG